MPFQFTLELSAQRIADLMTSCIEGNHMTRAWCDGIRWATKRQRQISFTVDGKTLNCDTYPWYGVPEVYENPDTCLIQVREIIDESKPPVGRNIRVHDLTYSKICEGLAIMARSYPHQFAAIMADDTDSVTADVFLQCCALGEVRVLVTARVLRKLF